MHNGVLDVFHALQQPVLFKPGHDGLAGLIARHAGKLAKAVHHDRMLVEDVDLLQPVRLTHGVVVGVVRRRHLHKPRAEGRIHVPVGKNRNLAAHDGQHDRRSHERGLIRIAFGHGHAAVA